MSEIKKTKRRSPSPPTPRDQAKAVSSSIRERVLNAAFSLFREHGFSSTSMLDIVTRARISKRDLYALFGNKHAVLAACISERTERMRRPLDITTPVPPTRDALTTLLVEFGISILKTMCHRDALTVFRLASMNLDISSWQVVWPRCVVIGGLSMVFAPLNVAAFLYIRPEFFSNMLHRPLPWVAVLTVLAGGTAIFTGIRSRMEFRAFAGSCVIIVGLLATGAGSIFPVILRSTLDSEQSLTVYNSSASRESLGVAIIWWPIALVLASC